MRGTLDAYAITHPSDLSEFRTESESASIPGEQQQKVRPPPALATDVTSNIPLPVAVSQKRLADNNTPLHRPDQIRD